MGTEQPEFIAATRAVRALMDAGRELTAHTARRLGMNATDLVALDLLDQLGPMGAAELARRLGIRSASATTLVDRLEQAGHVERVRDTADRRRVTVAPTAAAREATYAAFLPAILAVDEVGRGLDAAIQRVVADYLGRVTAALRDTP